MRRTTPPPCRVPALPDLVANPLAITNPLRPLVALLPFRAMGSDPALALLGGEIADVMRERLQRDPALQAILISSDFLAKAPPHALELICRELRVGWLLTGKCHPHPDAPSLYLELTDTHEWNVRWAEFYPCGARSLLAPDGEPLTRLATVLRQVVVERRQA